MSRSEGAGLGQRGHRWGGAGRCGGGYLLGVAAASPSSPPRRRRGWSRGGTVAIVSIHNAERCDVVLTSAPTSARLHHWCWQRRRARKGRCEEPPCGLSNPPQSPKRASQESAPPPSLARRDGGGRVSSSSRALAPRGGVGALSRGAQGHGRARRGAPRADRRAPVGLSCSAPPSPSATGFGRFLWRERRSRSHRIAVPAVGRARGKIRARGVREAPYNNSITTPAPGQRQWHPSRPASAVRRAPF